MIPPPLLKRAILQQKMVNYLSKTALIKSGTSIAMNIIKVLKCALNFMLFVLADVAFELKTGCYDKRESK
jgi:hypothetical protein